MSQTNTKTTVRCIGLALLLCGILFTGSPGAAGILDATWVAPTTNTDGSPLTDLSSYRVYYGASSSTVCPGSSWAQVGSPTSNPAPNQTLSFKLTGLTTGALYYVAVSAVDAGGNESACSTVASAVARAEFGVSPSGPVNFGSVSLGSFAEQTFTVSNTGGGTVSGTASASAPFSIVSGSPFALTGLGASQAVRVRFTPTTTTTASATVSFAAGGGSASTIVTGSGLGAGDSTPPTVTITSPTSGPTYSAPGASVTLQGTASDAVGVSQVTWANSRGGSGIANGTNNWTTGAIALQLGSNTITVTARDAAGNRATATLAVTLNDTAPPSVAITAPAGGAALKGTAALSANASDNVGVVGVQFKVDGVNLGAEVRTAPYTVQWSTTGVADGAHVLTAVARDSAGNATTSARVSVIVANAATKDATAPTISRVSTAVTASGVTIGWTTNEPSDTQVEYGPTTSYGALTPLNPALQTAHAQTISSLKPNTVYHFRVRSRDAAGNLRVSKDFRFKMRP